MQHIFPIFYSLSFDYVSYMNEKKYNRKLKHSEEADNAENNAIK